MMERQSARVVSGLRGDRKEGAVKANPVLAKRRKEGVVIFKAKAANYRLQFTAPNVVTLDPTTGRKSYSNPVAIQFRNYCLELDETKDADKIEFVMTRDAFGLGRDMWLLEDEQQVIVRDAVNGLMGQLAVIDPKLIPAELKQKLVSALGSDVKSELKLPAAPPA